MLQLQVVLFRILHAIYDFSTKTSLYKTGIPPSVLQLVTLILLSHHIFTILLWLLFCRHHYISACYYFVTVPVEILLCFKKLYSQRIGLVCISSSVHTVVHQCNSVGSESLTVQEGSGFHASFLVLWNIMNKNYCHHCKETKWDM
jgi:hypothetical protein